MNRTIITLEGAPPDGLRLELAWQTSPEGPRLEWLHDPKVTGTFARVARGRIVQGDLVLPVAVKLQRDLALSREDSRGVEAKFLMEQHVHHRLQTGVAPEELHQRPVARMVQVWADQEEPLPPCVVCSRARQALAPHCPQCREGLLEGNDLTRADDRRRLVCPLCHSEFALGAQEAVLQATVRRDPACAGCPQREAATPDCLTTATVLNFFPSRILLFELLDLDLDQFLRWWGAQPPGAASPRTVALFRAYRSQELQTEKGQSPEERGLHRLHRVVELMVAAVAGVRLLHQCQVIHLDLKLENVCVRFGEGGPRAKLIDLGLADDRQAQTYLRQALASRHVDSPFSAPEMLHPEDRPRQMRGRFTRNGCVVKWEGAGADLPCPGDTLLLQAGDGLEWRYTVRTVAPRDGKLLVHGSALPAGTGAPDKAQTMRLPVQLRRQCGPAADVFSLGMMLLALLFREPEVSRFRDQLANLRIVLEQEPRLPGQLPNRAWIALLLQRRSQFIDDFCQQVERLGELYGPAEPLARELLALALACTLRGELALCYLRHRGDNAGPGLEEFQKNLGGVRSAVDTALRLVHGEAQAGEVRQGRTQAWQSLAQPLPVLESPPGPPPFGPDIPVLVDLGGVAETFRNRERTLLACVYPEAAARDEALRRLRLDQFGAADREDLLWQLLAYAPPFVEESEAAVQLAQEWQRWTTPGRWAPPALRRWVEQNRDLAELPALWSGLQSLEEGLRVLQHEVFAPWQQAIDNRGFFSRTFSRTVPVTLTRDQRASLPNQLRKEADLLLKEQKDYAANLVQSRQTRFHALQQLWGQVSGRYPHLKNIPIREITGAGWLPLCSRRHQEWLTWQGQESRLLLDQLRQIHEDVMLPWDEALSRNGEASAAVPLPAKVPDDLELDQLQESLRRLSEPAQMSVYVWCCQLALKELQILTLA